MLALLAGLQPGTSTAARAAGEYSTTSICRMNDLTVKPPCSQAHPPHGRCICHRVVPTNRIAPAHARAARAAAAPGGGASGATGPTYTQARRPDEGRRARIRRPRRRRPGARILRYYEARACSIYATNLLDLLLQE